MLLYNLFDLSHLHCLVSTNNVSINFLFLKDPFVSML